MDTERKREWHIRVTRHLFQHLPGGAQAWERKGGQFRDRRFVQNWRRSSRERVETLMGRGYLRCRFGDRLRRSGLAAFTRFARVEYANGEEVPAERFLAEVETVVLETILARLSKEVGGKGGRYSLAGLDPPTRFYILWRYTYKAADLDAGEAIIFSNGTHVELDGPHGLSTGAHNLIEKKKGKYRLLDFSERGDDKHLGMPARMANQHRWWMPCIARCGCWRIAQPS